MIVRFAAKFLLGAALLMPAQFANAQTPGQNAPLPVSVVSDFMANPNQTLAQNGPQLTKLVRELLASDKNTLNPLIALLKLASPDQQTAIADGLAQAAKAYASNDPAFANQVQQSVAATGIPDVIKQYASIAGDTGTASTGGGGAAGGGGPNVAGAPTGGSNTGAFTGGNNFAANTTPNLLNGGSLGGANFSSFTPGSNTTTTSVSPQ
ncbi:hypothetical protein [Bradyrhizobium canariense]|uniref:Uncharacterized protein n=1 Tax=Bradyrhizobium canariense TaxID=255045 RepID=A0A1H2BNI4_9BRAD|nr:hypothetical protein [Bradyrhizobium canariense]SDT59479.1 hypothetical protein SAMN05444158_7348 [Bradyrhizobium canariense]